MNHTDSFLPTDLCYSYNSASITPESLLNITCTAGLVGRYVTIKRTAGGPRPYALTLCEVRVIADSRKCFIISNDLYNMPIKHVTE